jgi:hypothetical protein
MADHKSISTTCFGGTKMQQPKSVENIRSAVHRSVPRNTLTVPSLEN